MFHGHAQLPSLYPSVLQHNHPRAVAVAALQYKFAGTGTDLPLMEWLQKYTFPIESSHSDPEHSLYRYGRCASAVVSVCSEEAVLLSKVQCTEAAMSPKSRCAELNALMHVAVHSCTESLCVRAFLMLYACLGLHRLKQCLFYAQGGEEVTSQWHHHGRVLRLLALATQQSAGGRDCAAGAARGRGQGARRWAYYLTLSPNPKP